MIETKEVLLNLGEYEGILNSNVQKLKSTNSTVEHSVGLDLGSTANRVVPYNVEIEDLFGECVEVCSDIGVVGDISHIKSTSKKVHDNLEFIIKDVTTPDKKSDYVFKEQHFVKYGLYNSVKNQPLSRPSKVSKVDLPATYLNALSAVAVEIYSNSCVSGLTHSCYHVTPSITLPPEDFKSSIFTERFKERLQGHYEVHMPRLGVKFNILIKKESIFLDKEPNAVVYKLASEYEDIQGVTSVIIDGGGKSIDISLVVDGVLVEKGSETLAYGGSRLIDLISEEYVRIKGKSAPNEDAIQKSLVGGNLVRGNVEEPIHDITTAAKKTMAYTIYNDILKVFDKAELAIDDIGFIAFHGRLFKPTANVAGIDTCLLSEVHKVNPSLKSCTVTDTATIATGVIISRLVDEVDLEDE